MRSDIFDHLAAIDIPLPDHPDTLPPVETELDDWQHDAAVDAYTTAVREREERAEQLRLITDEAGDDPLLTAIAEQRRIIADAERHIRALIAYGREFVTPRPYTLADLAKAAGMSISGIRTAYDHAEVAAVAAATGLKPREWRAQDPDPDPGEAPA
jgi:hypothetical protein